ncbi:DUF721 domain-containing protein [Commensalibacter sp. M0402]|uniref:DUF721 domain-containing protein n=1 Tax=Commensalibacter TaxID=1079922 RepID=UPI0018DC6CC7|nr:MULTISPECIES: DUF721 domain-containing protein [Commensalibacter]MBI0083132.1 DUF721 domain-containing protein [Commensalibacter sp. W6292M3]MBI0088050.1 DUF721 domain-containing protein [Commensalibacter melissae]
MTNIPKQNQKKRNLSQTSKEQNSRHPDRRTFTMSQIGGTVHSLTKQVFRQKSLAHSQISINWVDIIGPIYGNRTSPRHLANGTLTIACSNTTATELQYFSERLIEKINLYFGQKIVARLKFVYQRYNTYPLTKSINHSSLVEPVEIPILPPGPLQNALSRLGGHIQIKKKGKN